MENLLLTVAKGLVNEPEKVSVTVDEPKEDGSGLSHPRCRGRHGKNYR